VFVVVGVMVGVIKNSTKRLIHAAWHGPNNAGTNGLEKHLVGIQIEAQRWRDAEPGIWRLAPSIGHAPSPGLAGARPRTDDRRLGGRQRAESATAEQRQDIYLGMSIT
jgi:hypothetical protein